MKQKQQIYDMTYEEAQDYISKRGLDIPWNDNDVVIDERNIMQTVANVLAWADSHPHWIPVEERLPEIPKNDWKSDNVLFVVNGEIFYGYRCKYTWFAPFVPFNNHQVTHWMPIVPPRKED